MSEQFEITDEARTAMFEAVGHFTVAAAVLEDRMRALYGVMVDAPGAFLLATGQSFGPLRAACLALQREFLWHPNDQRFTSVLLEAHTLMERRNEIVHGTWISIRDIGPVVFRSRNWQIRTIGNPLSVEEMHALAQALWDIGAAVEELQREGCAHRERPRQSAFHGLDIDAGFVWRCESCERTFRVRPDLGWEIQPEKMTSP